MILRYILLFMIIAFLDSCKKDKLHIIWSPNKQNKTTVFIDHGNLKYQFEQNGEIVIDTSLMGLKTKESFFENLVLTNVEKGIHSSEWKPTWGVNSSITDTYNSLKLSFKDSKTNSELKLIIRLYNEGLAFKYEGVANDLSILEKELTEFNISSDAKSWVLVHPWGKRYKKDIPIQDVKNASLPLLTKQKNGRYILVTEAELYNYGSLHLSTNTNGILSADVVGEVKLKPQFVTPWRVVMTANSPDYFVNHNYIIQNLNAPSKIKDSSWIKPGITTWDWRTRGAIEGELSYELNTETLLHFIDKTAELGLPYFMVDAEWYGPERKKKSNPLTAIPEIDINAFINRAKEKNVGIWLYVNRIAFQENDIDELLSTYKSWGIVGIKLGFLKMMDQKGVELLQEVLEKCAKYKIMLNCHESVIPSGIERTWPHFLTREYNHSLEDGGYSASPIDHTITPFLNNIAGPIDVTPGFFDIDQMTSRNYVRSRLKSTVVAQAAMCFTYYTPMLCLPDIPEAYQRKPELFSFIKSLPFSYDESKVLIGEIEKKFVIARRKGNHWWIAGICNEEGAQIQIDLSFLDKGDYEVLILTDGTETNWKENREKYTSEKKLISKNEKLNLKMAPGGGVCLKFVKSQ